jgi:hypothetical protein
LAVEASREFATKILRTQSGRTSSGAEYLDAVVEIANTAQLKLDPNHRSRMLEVRIYRLDVRGHEQARGIRAKLADKAVLWAVLGSDPNAFSEHQREFHALLDRLWVGDAEGASRLAEAERASAESSGFAVDWRPYFQAGNSGSAAALAELEPHTRVRVTTSHGRVVSGKVVWFVRRVLTVTTDDGDDVEIPESDIARVETPGSESGPSAELTEAKTRDGARADWSTPTSQASLRALRGTRVVVRLASRTSTGILRAHDASVVVVEGSGGQLDVIDIADVRDVSADEVN